MINIFYEKSLGDPSFRTSIFKIFLFWYCTKSKFKSFCNIGENILWKNSRKYLNQVYFRTSNSENERFPERVLKTLILVCSRTSIFKAFFDHGEQTYVRVIMPELARGFSRVKRERIH